ncbi:MAG: alpha/beta hydrolase [Spirochaetota bacterium]
MNTGRMNGRDGSGRTYYHWKSSSKAKSAVIFSHGYAEHAGRYAEMAAELNRAGYDVWAIDHYGHGQSAGKRADVKDFRLFAEDLHLFIQNMVIPNTDTPLFLYGHSMGGAISLLYTLEHQSDLKGLILSGPMIRPGGVSSPFERKIAHLLRKIVPTLPFRPFSADLLSHDVNEVQAYKDDPLNYTGKLKVRLGDEFLRMEGMLSEEALAAVSLPVLLLHGGGDTVVPPENSQIVMESISSEDKTRKLFPGLYHEIHKEAERREVFATIIDWLNARV